MDERAGPDSQALLEPPGLFAVSFGASTPVVTVLGHLAYGSALGMFLGTG